MAINQTKRRRNNQDTNVKTEEEQDVHCVEWLISALFQTVTNILILMFLLSPFYYEIDIVLHLHETIPHYKFGRLQAAKFSSGKSSGDHATHLTPAEKRSFAFFN